MHALSQFATALPTSAPFPGGALAAAHRSLLYSADRQRLAPARPVVDFNQRQTLIIAILVLFAGRHLTRRFAPLRDWNIPEPVTGGVIASLLAGALYLAFDVRIGFELAGRDILLIVFFTTIGLNANVRMLARGGAMLGLLTAFAVANNVVQDLVGIGVATLAGAPPATGILAGSAALAGGHGTVIAWAPVFRERFGIGNAMEIGVAAATFGLVAGGILGGPIGRYLVRRHGLDGPPAAPLSVGATYAEEPRQKIDASGALNTLLAIAVAMGLGGYLNDYAANSGLVLPQFVTALFSGILLSNLVPTLLPRLAWPAGTPALALAADVSLGLTLAMSLMSLQLWTLLAAAGPLFAILGAQVVVACLLAVFVLYPLLGRGYDAAVAAAGFFGLGLGATPTAIAIMAAVTKEHGASPRALLVVPLVGAFFVDIANAATIQAFVARLAP